jgi:AcrR family transcriptional regulator
VATSKAKRQSASKEDPIRRAVSAIKDQELLFERRVHLVDVATRVLIDRGFSSVSVNEIADEAGISIGSLYKYVRSKHDLLWLVLDSIYREMEEAFEPGAREHPPLEEFRLTFESFLRRVHLVRRGMLLIYREFPNLTAESQKEFLGRDQRVFAHLQEMIARGNELGAWSADPRLAAINLYATGDSWTLKGWIMRDISLEVYIAKQTQLMLAMLGAPAAAPSEPPARARRSRDSEDRKGASARS